MDAYEAYDEILRRLGRIEGQLDAILGLSERVRQLELWQAWLKGGWVGLVGAFVYLCKETFGK